MAYQEQLCQKGKKTTQKYCKAVKIKELQNHVFDFEFKCQLISRNNEAKRSEFIC